MCQPKPNISLQRTLDPPLPLLPQGQLSPQTPLNSGVGHHNKESFMRRVVQICLLSTAMLPSVSPAASDGDIDKLTTYATVLGRGIACGADT